MRRNLVLTADVRRQETGFRGTASLSYYISVSRVPVVRSAFISGLCACSRHVQKGTRVCEAAATIAPLPRMRSLVVLATRLRLSPVHILRGACSCCQLARSAAAASSQRRERTAKWQRGGGERTAISLQQAELSTRRVGQPGHPSLMAAPSPCKVRVCGPVHMRHAAYCQDGHDEQPVR
eukprot:COSAG01_NODE_3345_length_6226_cov_40.305043_3_plen_179_part_00